MEYVKQVIMDSEGTIVKLVTLCVRVCEVFVYKVYAGINGKFFKDLESYGLYLAEYNGYEIYKLPYIRKEHL